MGLEVNPYQTSSTPYRPTTAPQGGAGWSIGLTPQPLATPDTYNASDPRQVMLATAQQGISQGLIGQNQLSILQNDLNTLTPGQLNSLQGLLGQATQPVEQVFILKAFAAGEPWNNIVDYANQIRGQQAQTIIAGSTVTSSHDLIQQWQDACAPTVVQTAAAEMDPRYAWTLHHSGNASSIDPYGSDQAIAAQQQQWLQQYGGVAVPRGQSGGTGIALGTLLNAQLGPIIHASYSTQEVSDPNQAVNQIAQNINQGFDVPLRISWNPPNAGADDGHFVLAIGAKGTPGNYQIEIHDPWTGQTNWVSQQGIASNSFSPIFNTYARLSYYYPATPGAAAPIPSPSYA
ncbi:MAG TPA: hypothetical protein V6D47_16235 [Oscillatoriaceae cyanobacterium]